jgi:hypothetical protein
VKPGDLVKVIRPNVLPGIELGDLAILTEIDWDHRDYPIGITGSGDEVITGRGYFFFPNKPEINATWGRGGRKLGPMLIFNNFEVISETG